MKAQRRHELQENALATKIVQLPNLGRIWLGRAVTALLVIAVIAAFIVSRFQRSHQAEVEAGELLANARQDIQTLQSIGPSSRFEPEPLDAMFITRAQTAYDSAMLKLQQAVERSSDKRWLGQAAVLRGDANLALATIPAVPGATTQPSLAPHPSREQAFTDASNAYKEVLEKYSDQPINVIAAQLGLAAIALDQQDLKAARDHYQAVANDANASQLFRQFARRQLDLLPTFGTTPLIVSSPVPALPKVTPATSQAATVPSTTPSK